MGCALLNHKYKNVPTDKGYTKIYSNASVFSAVKPDGSIRTWGNPDFGGAYASEPESVHALIEPSALRAAKPKSFE
jgi:hypothetical protein